MSDRNEKLGIIVEATDNASGKLSNVKREIAGIGSAASSSRFGSFVGSIQSGASKIKSSLGGAFSHAKGQLLGLLKTPLAGLGLGLGAAGVVKFFADSVGGASTFGEAVANVAKVTGLAIPVASSLVDTLQKWGLTEDRIVPILGRQQKNLEGLAGTKKKAIAFEKQYGLSLVDTKGHLLDTNALLLRSADYFNNKSIPAAQRSAAMQKIWGKTWTDLIPILSKGSKGIQDEEKNSIQLTQAQIDNIEKYRDAARNFKDELGDLKVKIGATLMPLITEGLRGLGDWIGTHSDQVVQFVSDAAGAAKGIASTVISTLGGIKSVWDGIPDPVKDLLIKGVAAERTVKFLFGISLTGVAQDLVGGVAGGVGNAIIKAGIGKAFIQPVFVTNPGFGSGVPSGPSVPGGPSVPVAGGGGPLAALGLLGTALTGMIVGIEASGAGRDNPDRVVDPNTGNIVRRSLRYEAEHGQPQRVALTERQESILSHQAATMDALERNRLSRATSVVVKSTTNVKVSVSTRSVGSALKSQSSFASSTNTNRTGGAVDEGDLW